MNGIERAKDLFTSAGVPMLEKLFPEYLDKIACGIAGRGSECFGFDDEISRDHDFEDGFCLWITPETDAEIGFKLHRAYRELAGSFPRRESARSLYGSANKGVMIIDDFYRRRLGFPGAPECWQQWLYTPEYAFAEAVNGEVFRDEYGKFTEIRQKILSGIPEDVWKKKVAARAVLMAQSGQYNFARCLRHGERGAAMLALGDFVRHSASMVFLLNRRFAPYWKWALRAMKKLPRHSNIANELEELLLSGKSDGEKIALIEKISLQIADHLRETGISSTTESYLEAHAVEINEKITSREIRELHLMDGA